jgi:arylsulfatase
MVLVDTLRADHLGCYGYSLPTSPFIDKLAGEGALFESCRAQAPWTKPSVASLFTSLSSSAHQVISYPRLRGDALDPHLDRRDILPKQALTIAEALSGMGYHTAAFVANRWVDPIFGFAQGFDDYVTVYSRKAPGDQGKIELVVNPPARCLNNILDQYLSTRYRASWKDFLRFIGVHRKPLFLYLHYMDVHGPYQAPAPFTAFFDDAYKGRPDLTLPADALEKWKYLYQDTASLNFYKARYDAQIRNFDYEMERLMGRLRELSRDRLVVILTADHGESFFGHQTLEHGNSEYEEEIRVPLIVWGAPELPAGTRARAPVELIDVAPTIMEMLGAPRPEQFEGKSLIAVSREGGDADYP